MGTNALPSVEAYKEIYDQGKVFTPYESDHGFGGFAVPKIDCSKTKDKDCEYEVGVPVGTDLHYTMNLFADRLQEPLSLE